MKDFSKVHQLWQSTASYPKWAREFIRAGLIRYGISIQYDNQAWESGCDNILPDGEVMAKEIIDMLKALDIEVKDDEQAQEILQEMNIGIMHLDDIVRFKGLFNFQLAPWEL